MVQQLHKNQLSLDQVEILNVSCENKGESLLNISLEKVLAVDVVHEIAVIDNKIKRVSEY